MKLKPLHIALGLGGLWLLSRSPVGRNSVEPSDDTTTGGTGTGTGTGQSNLTGGQEIPLLTLTSEVYPTTIAPSLDPNPPNLTPWAQQPPPNEFFLDRIRLSEMFGWENKQDAWLHRVNVLIPPMDPVLLYEVAYSPRANRFAAQSSQGWYDVTDFLTPEQKELFTARPAPTPTTITPAIRPATQPQVATMVRPLAERILKAQFGVPGDIASGAPQIKEAIIANIRPGPNGQEQVTMPADFKWLTGDFGRRQEKFLEVWYEDENGRLHFTGVSEWGNLIIPAPPGAFSLVEYVGGPLLNPATGHPW